MAKMAKTVQNRFGTDRDRSGIDPGKSSIELVVLLSIGKVGDGSRNGMVEMGHRNINVT